MGREGVTRKARSAKFQKLFRRGNFQVSMLTFSNLTIPKDTANDHFWSNVNGAENVTFPVVKRRILLWCAKKA